MQRINSPDSQFHDGNPATGAIGTFLAAPWHNSVQEEIAGVIESTGLQLNPNDNGQLLKALAAHQISNAPLSDIGKVNAYAATNAVPLTAATLVHGVRQRVTIATTNNGASTYSPDGLPPKPIIGLNLAALVGLEVLAGQIAEFEYVVAAAVNDGSGAWLLIRCGGGAAQLSAGTYGVTPLQFDNSAKLATTASVIATGLQYPGGITDVIADTTLTPAACGGIVNLHGTGSFTVKLPLSANCPVGATISFISSVAATAVPQGTDTVVGGAPLTFQGGNDTVVLANAGNGIWWKVAGSLQLQGNAAGGVFGMSATASGYQKLPSGLIVQWGNVITSASGAVVVTYPLAFPNALFSFLATAVDGSTNASLKMFALAGGAAITNGKAQFALYTVAAASGAYGAVGTNWIAIGH